MYHIEAKVCLEPSESLDVLTNENAAIEDWARYREQILEGINEALNKAGEKRKFLIKVITHDLSGKTPPVGYKASVMGAMLNALGINPANIT